MSLSRPGTVLAAVEPTCGPKAKGREKQCESIPGPFVMQCQLPRIRLSASGPDTAAPSRFSLLWGFNHPSNISLIWGFKAIP